MIVPAEKLELIQMLMALEQEEVLAKIKSLLLKNMVPINDETSYLNSTMANKKMLEEGIRQLNNGEGTVIPTKELWK